MSVTKVKRPSAARERVLAEVRQFLYREARLLDHGRFDEWLALFSDDATYWVPLLAGQADPRDTCSILYDDRRLLEVRVRQFTHPRAHARTPAPRTVHHVSNIELLGDDGRELRVASTLVMLAYRHEQQHVWGARVEHRLRRTETGLRIAAKRVDLVNSESELPGIVCLF